MSRSILLVEDEAPICEMIRFALSREGFEVTEAYDAREAEARLAEGLPDLALIDWMLPGVSGVELLRRLRRDELTAELPVIMLTARGEETDKISGLDAGADDYLTKPFSTRELAARIRSLLRRASQTPLNGLIAAGDLNIDTNAHRVTVAGQRVSLGPTEFKLLQFFVTHPNRVYSRSQLLDNVWSRGAFVAERTVDVHVLRLRKALQPFGVAAMVQTIRGAGYLFSAAA